jgi:hypothetical protein
MEKNRNTAALKTLARGKPVISPTVVLVEPPWERKHTELALDFPS